MATPDFSKYTDEQLLQSLESINAEKYSQAKAELDAIIKQRGLDNLDSPDSTSGIRKVGSIFSRIVAYFLDHLVIQVLIWVLGVLLIIGSDVATKNKVDTILIAVYFIVLHWLYGQTFGKRLLGLEVVDHVSNGELSFKQAIMRYLPNITLSAIGLMFIYEYDVYGEIIVSTTFWVYISVTMAWQIAEIICVVINKDNRALHDLIAGTVVIKNK